MKDRWRKFKRLNGICWRNVLAYPRYFIWVWGMWAKHWRKSEPHIWKVIPRVWLLFARWSWWPLFEKELATLGIRRFHLAVDDKCYVCGNDMVSGGVYWSVDTGDLYYTGFCCTLWCAIRWRIGWKKLMKKRKDEQKER
jgi:hypothetical protein